MYANPWKHVSVAKKFLLIETRLNSCYFALTAVLATCFQAPGDWKYFFLEWGREQNYWLATLRPNNPYQLWLALFRHSVWLPHLIDDNASPVTYDSCEAAHAFLTPETVGSFGVCAVAHPFQKECSSRAKPWTLRGVSLPSAFYKCYVLTSEEDSEKKGRALGEESSVYLVQNQL